MSKIPISNNKYALVDEGDFIFLKRFKWTLTSNGYAKTNQDMYMHRMVMGAGTNRTVVDHINRDKLDNRQHNLRITTQSVNLINSVSSRGSSRYRGVFRSRLRWCAQFRHRHLGVFDTEEEAGEAYSQAKTAHLLGVGL